MSATNEGAFCGSRLRLARLFAGLSLKSLGESASVSAPYVHQIESGKRQPPEILAEAFGELLGFRSVFFYGPPVDEFLEEECHFRRRKTTPAAVKTRALAHGSLFGMLVEYLDAALELPEKKIPTVAVTSNEDIELAAERCRMQWGLGRDVPIKNLTRAAENAGIVVTIFVGESAKIDAFSRGRRGARPLVVLNREKGSTSRARFDLAHECGHLIMHSGIATGDDHTEAQANRFASALLMPRIGIAREFPRTVDWMTLFALKSRWGASVAAMVRRAYDIGLITATDYQRAYKYMSYQGWHKGEPEEPPQEQPETVGLSLSELGAGAKVPLREVAEHLGWRPRTFEKVSGFSLPEEPSAPIVTGRVVDLRAKKMAAG